MADPMADSPATEIMVTMTTKKIFFMIPPPNKERENGFQAILPQLKLLYFSEAVDEIVTAPSH